MALLQLLDDVRLAGGREERRQPVVVLDDLVRDDARRDVSGPADICGTRNAPSQFVFFSLRNGVMAPSGQVFMCGPLSVAVQDDRVVGDPEPVEHVEQLTDVPVVVDHRVVVGRLPSAGLAEALRFVCVRRCMWVKFTQQKNGFLLLCWR